PDGHRLYAGTDGLGNSKDNYVRVWDFDAARPGTQMRLADGHSIQHEALEVSADGRWIAVTSYHEGVYSVWIWSADGRLSSKLDFLDNITTLSFDPTNNRLLLGSASKTLTWDAYTGSTALLPEFNERASNA